jgi:CRP-like cAMP-binding protein
MVSAVHSDPRSNGLLACLAPDDFALLSPQLKRVTLDEGMVLQEPEAPIERVCFPLNGMISLLVVMREGQTIEIATVGSEGAVGTCAALGHRRAFTRAVVQVPGLAWSVSASLLQRALAQSERMRDVVLRYRDSLMAQVLQTAACNALHPIEGRLARRLLQTADRIPADLLPLTQDMLAQILGVRRTTVTAVAQKLQADGLIRYRRGRIEIADRRGLEAQACECYEAIAHWTAMAAETEPAAIREPA